MTRRLALAGFSACFMLTGCNAPPTPPRPDADAAALTAPGPAPAPPAVAPAPLDATRMVQWKTDAHLVELQAAAQARSKPATRPASLPPPAVPEVQWVEPSEVAMTIGPKQSEDPPHAAMQTSSAAVPAEPLRPARPVADDLENALSRQVANDPRDLAARIDYELLRMLSGKPVPEMDRINSLSGEDREMVAALLDALINLRANVRGQPNLMLAGKIRPLVDLADRLRTQGALRIPTIALCRSVDAFGVYEPLPAARFLAGREQAVIVYCEVENFVTRLNDQRMWETNLAQEAVLYSDLGQRVWDEKRVPAKDLSRNLRRDFYLARKIRIPGNLPPGRYHLKVTISDNHSSRIAEAGTAIEVAAKP